MHFIPYHVFIYSYLKYTFIFKAKITFHFIYQIGYKLRSVVVTTDTKITIHIFFNKFILYTLFFSLVLQTHIS